MNKKLTLLITSLLFSSFVLSESVNTFCADLVRKSQKVQDCDMSSSNWDAWSKCAIPKDDFYHYLGIIEGYSENPSVERQFNRCVRKKVNEIGSSQKDNDFLKYLNKY